MQWVNISTTFLDGPEFIGSDPVERATWLCLLRYCVGQENGGVIKNCRDWKDRKWQQVVRVTLREVAESTRLWAWSGEDLIVTGYPVSKEEEVKAKRIAGTKTANLRWKRDSSAISSATNSASSSAHSSGPGSYDSSRDAERKGIGKEGNNTPYNPPLADNDGSAIRPATRQPHPQERPVDDDPTVAALYNQLPAIPTNLEDPAFHQAWQEWLLYLQEAKLPRIPRTLWHQMNECSKWGVHLAFEAIRHSIAKGYRAIYLPRESDTKPENRRGIAKPDEHKDYSL